MNKFEEKKRKLTKNFYNKRNSCKKYRYYIYILYFNEIIVLL